MIALLSCFINSYANDNESDECDSIPLTGEVVQPSDSVAIAYDDLRIVNSKLIELKYEKEINNKLRQIVDNDKDIISNYKALNDKLNKDCKKAIIQRNIFIGVSIVATICAIVFIAK